MDSAERELRRLAAKQKATIDTWLKIYTIVELALEIGVIIFAWVAWDWRAAVLAFLLLWHSNMTSSRKSAKIATSVYEWLDDG
jgi:hypothetical protein